MKRSHKRLLIFELVLLFLLFLNSFIFNIFSGYLMTVFLLLILFIYKIFFGIEKDRYVYKKDVILDIIIFLLIFFLLFYILGIGVGFTRIDNYYSVSGIFNVILPIVLFIIVKEFLRHSIFCKIRGNNILIVLTVILFVFLDVTNIVYYSEFNDFYDIFLFISIYLLPAISNNILCTYLVSKVGYKPSIIYLLFINLYQYLIPIIPNPNDYVLSIINFFLPLVLWYRITLFFKKVEFQKIKVYKKISLIGLILSSILVLLLVYLTSGYFHYSAIAVGSNSMKNEINKGDVVIIEKVEEDYSDIKIGDILVYNYGGVIIVHRVVSINSDNGNYIFSTKGDMNNLVDNYDVYEEMVIGVVKLKIPFVGLPTVWLSGL